MYGHRISYAMNHTNNFHTELYYYDMLNFVIRYIDGATLLCTHCPLARMCHNKPNFQTSWAVKPSNSASQTCPVLLNKDFKPERQSRNHMLTEQTYSEPPKLVIHKCSRHNYIQRFSDTWACIKINDFQSYNPVRKGMKNWYWESAWMPLLQRGISEDTFWISAIDYNWEHLFTLEQIFARLRI